MKNKTLIIILWTTSMLFLILVFGSYVFNFSEFNISDNPENWGQFGDYIGGLLNPFISILNLIILTYLSIRLVKNDDDRNTWTVMELARPYGEIDFDKNLGNLCIKVSNLGLGPMIIKEIKLIHKDGNVYSDFKHLPDNVKQISEFTFGTFSLSRDHCVIGKENNINLVQISGDIKDPNYAKNLINFIIELNQYSVEILYFDMYDRQIDKIKDNVQFSEVVIGHNIA